MYIKFKTYNIVQEYMSNKTTNKSKQMIKVRIEERGTLLGGAFYY